MNYTNLSFTLSFAAGVSELHFLMLPFLSLCLCLKTAKTIFHQFHQRVLSDFWMLSDYFCLIWCYVKINK